MLVPCANAAPVLISTRLRTSHARRTPRSDSRICTSCLPTRVVVVVSVGAKYWPPARGVDIVFGRLRWCGPRDPGCRRMVAGDALSGFLAEDITGEISSAACRFHDGKARC